MASSCPTKPANRVYIDARVYHKHSRSGSEAAHHLKGRCLQIKPEEHVLIERLLVSDCWIVAFLDLKSGDAQHFGQLSREH